MALVLCDPTGAIPERVLELDGSPEWPIWLDDDRLAYCGPFGEQMELCALSLSSGQVTRLTVSDAVEE